MVALDLRLKDATDNIDKRKKLSHQATKSTKHWKNQKGMSSESRKESLND
jgi:hypothetical protein